MDIIIPCCGESTRYPGETPKWAYRKSSNSMLQMSVMGVRGYDRLFVVHLKKHRKFLQNAVPKDAILIELPEQTGNQCETVYKSLQYIDSTSFVIKDCDNYVDIDLNEINTDFVGHYPLGKMLWMHVSNKSYLKISPDGNLDEMVEKQVISTNFGVGVYGIKDRSQFCKLYMECKHKYFSSVMNDINHSGKIVKCIEVKKYIDWGTIHDWNTYIDNLS